MIKLAYIDREAVVIAIICFIFLCLFIVAGVCEILKTRDEDEQ